MTSVHGSIDSDRLVRLSEPAWTAIAEFMERDAAFPACIANGSPPPIFRQERWLYVAAVVDLFSRRVVGWSMSAAMAARLVTDALVMATWRRGKPDALLHHSDRGSQYTSEQFQRLDGR